MELLPTISPNNVFPNAPPFQMTHSQKTHLTFVCNNAQSDLMELHKTCTASKIAGCRITPMNQQGCVLKPAHLVSLLRTKPLDATETAMPPLMLTQPLVAVSKTVQSCMSSSSTMKHRVVSVPARQVGMLTIQRENARDSAHNRECMHTN